ncbi:MAG: Txe/YoeB family addiction module toxin [Micromonosporaceae bacterium]|nr:Txe/YoeB family addiction module toxin [Micromonosporaceae bacterium]
MIIVFSTDAWDDYVRWQTEDRKVAKRINELIKDIQRHGHQGVGKPELFRHEFSGYWSRRITHEHRLVYKITDSELRVVACRYHYQR